MPSSFTHGPPGEPKVEQPQPHTLSSGDQPAWAAPDAGTTPESPRPGVAPEAPAESRPGAAPEASHTRVHMHACV